MTLLREAFDRIWNDPVVRCPKHVVRWADTESETSEGGRVTHFTPEGEGLFWGRGKRVDVDKPKHGLGRQS
jgi:hypothetical protein